MKATATPTLDQATHCSTTNAKLFTEASSNITITLVGLPSSPSHPGPTIAVADGRSVTEVSLPGEKCVRDLADGRDGRDGRKSDGSDGSDGKDG
jgi:hypothetical protein